jgi:hypothetical protein
MGSALYIVLERDIDGFDPFVNGKALSVHNDDLDRLAKEIGVTPLMDFFSVSPEEALDFIQGEFEASGEEMPELPPPHPEKWFLPDEGLRTVQALQEHLVMNKESPQDWKGVLSDLDEFEKVLKRAQKENVRWHLGVDF